MKFLSTKGVTRMKKSNWLCGIAYVVAGIIFLLIGIFTDTKLDSLMFGFAGAGIIPGMVMIYKYFYWNSPNNVERYKEKLEAEKGGIDLLSDTKKSYDAGTSNEDMDLMNSLLEGILNE